MINLFKKYSYGIYLGFSLGMFMEASIDWEFYAVLVPVVMLVEWKAYYT